MSLPNAHLLERSDTIVRLAITADTDLIHFAGHFPGTPILPGVAQVDWAIRFAIQFFAPAGTCQHLDALKFNDRVLPGDTLELTLDWSPDKNTLRFAYTADGRAKSSGKAVFQA
ncbi:MAG: 3-hydroxyacyl-ACP dehydratase [Zoogloeaceae bacterium]|uniref:ApeI family dehydratase n=1 Tax=Denitromonas sp. TaxID=2734609 RepID=UPI001DB1E5A5|nr:hypothetical protein [Rhodocyclaceae bacterium]MCP5221708.1 3-hydroxyacyl-ACP dehydratase [Zoogloeaceae bacterium]HPR07020.1 hypothetical protein [Denitromonas sp.]